MVSQSSTISFGRRIRENTGLVQCCDFLSTSAIVGRCSDASDTVPSTDLSRLYREAAPALAGLTDVETRKHRRDRHMPWNRDWDAQMTGQVSIFLQLALMFALVATRSTSPSRLTRFASPSGDCSGFALVDRQSVLALWKLCPDASRNLDAR